ncbi:tRNA threonylcarbamoyladenosine biosynthesis protein TsaB [Candidatus Syntrophocurvum alkaliphilum]|uniref:tRNA threonylcarbamoyladenosine biosynthesis protein TsaB n=1 Tax=Candidatus Syntrophocurvum alkaliphilum TaxID=2293317 RepID=A0A6I6DDZ6_9FIRM|nr:tRNA threonylcarbamoyladenosine biosynthesis protein TsaB [Candidatus Syntrophocurvum alkaliphilum]
MLVLAVDSATPTQGVALFYDNRLIKEEFTNIKKTHSETLMLVIDRVLNECSYKVDDLDAIAISIGPGSFTGLRIGLATVKGLCQGANISLIGIPTLDAMAENVYSDNALICPLLNARKQEVYTAIYTSDSYRKNKITDYIAVSPEKLCEIIQNQLHNYNKDKVIFLGDGYEPYKEVFQQKLDKKVMCAPLHMMYPRASSMGAIAIDKYNKQEFDDPFAIRPLYLRLSEAENRLGRGAL